MADNQNILKEIDIVYELDIADELKPIVSMFLYRQLKETAGNGRINLSCVFNQSVRKTDQLAISEFFVSMMHKLYQSEDERLIEADYEALCVDDSSKVYAGAKSNLKIDKIIKELNKGVLFIDGIEKAGSDDAYRRGVILVHLITKGLRKNACSVVFSDSANALSNISPPLLTMARRESRLIEVPKFAL